MIILEGITHQYHRSKQLILDNFQLRIEDKEIVGLVGPSGCGKSTIARIMAGHIMPRAGRVLIDGRDFTGIPNRNVFLIHQDFDLFPWQTVERHIEFALKGQQKSKIDEILELVRLTDSRKLFPGQLSGGMRKRLAIARALALNPQLLILDEAFSYLDRQIKDSLHRDLGKIWERTGTGILLITHDQVDLEQLAQRVINMTETGR